MLVPFGEGTSSHVSFSNKEAYIPSSCLLSTGQNVHHSKLLQLTFGSSVSEVSESTSKQSSSTYLLGALRCLTGPNFLTCSISASSYVTL